MKFGFVRFVKQDVVIKTRTNEIIQGHLRASYDNFMEIERSDTKGSVIMNTSEIAWISKADNKEDTVGEYSQV